MGEEHNEHSKVFIALFGSLKMEYRVAVGPFGLLIGSTGGFILFNQRFPQRWNAAPSVEGPLASVGGLVLIGFGIYYLYSAIIKRTKNDEER